MNENSRIVVRVEYESEGIMRVWYGEIDKIKLEGFHSGKDNFILMENETWIDKHSILSIDELDIKTRLHEKTSLGATSQGQDAII